MGGTVPTANRICSHRDWQPGTTLDHFVKRTRVRLGRRRPMSDQPAPSPVVQAEINGGNWVVRCPYCTGSELVDFDDLRFWCLSCDMDANGGQWLRIAVPDTGERQRLQTELLKRAKPSTRSWLPGETVARLRAERKQLEGRG